jgi:uncharacterized delta-60 repeat protein
MKSMMPVVARLTVLALGFAMGSGLPRGATADDMLRPWAQDQHQTGRKSVDTAWVRRYDGPAHGDDWATCIAVDSSGNVYVAGTSMSDTGQNTQYLDFVTIKYYPNGDTAWVRRSDFGGKDLPSGLGVDTQGNVYVAGTNNDSRMVTVKYSPTGNRLWYKFFGSQGGASDLVLDSHGSIVVCGSSYRASSDAATVKYRPNGDTAWARFYDWAGLEDYAVAVACGQTDDIAVSGYGASATSHYDCVTVKYDSSGNRLWAAGYDGPNHGDDRTYHVAVDGGGNVVAVGYGDNGYTTPYDYLTIKYDLTGETLWTRRYDGPANGDDRASAVAVDSSGNIYVTGYSYVTGAQPNCATIKYAPDGRQLWVALFGGPIANYGRGSAVALDDAGGVYVCGISAFTLGAYGDYATIKYNAATGETVWTRGYNGPASDVDRAQAIAVDRRGCGYVTGESYGIGTNLDFATIKYVQDGGVLEKPLLVAPVMTVSAMPSPVASRTTVRFGFPREVSATLRVFDMAGRVVGTLHHGLASAGWHSVVWNRIDDQGTWVPAGVYMVVLDAGGASLRTKLTVLE